MLRTLIENARTGFVSLWSRKLRSFLTMLGIIIGVFAIIMLLGIGQGVKQEVTKQVTELGSNLIVILPGKVETENGGFNPTASLGASTLTEDDLETVRSLPEIEASSVLSLLAGLPSVGDRVYPSSFNMAVESSFFSLFSTADLKAGRLFTDDDMKNHARVMVIDRGPRRALFPDLTPEAVVGQGVKFGQEEFTVVGVVETPESTSVFGGQNFSSALFVPYTTAEEVIENTQIFRIILQARAESDVKAVAEKVRTTMRDSHGGTEDFTVFTQEDIIEVFNEIISVLTAAIVGIGSISLLVGGIGIMNIMLVSVTERTREIGLRKAIGASDGNILSQFLTEAVLLSLAGGAVGILLAWAASIPIKAQANLTVLIDEKSAGIAFGFSVLVGILFGVAPAIRAARLNPIEALRYE